jgi:hypothetical protein
MPIRRCGLGGGALMTPPIAGSEKDPVRAVDEGDSAAIKLVRRVRLTGSAAAAPETTRADTLVAPGDALHPILARRSALLLQQGGDAPMGEVAVGSVGPPAPPSPAKGPALGAGASLKPTEGSWRHG